MVYFGSYFLELLLYLNKNNAYHKQYSSLAFVEFLLYSLIFQVYKSNDKHDPNEQVHEHVYDIIPFFLTFDKKKKAVRICLINGSTFT